MKILDLTAGNRAIWYNKWHSSCMYLDKRESVNPDILCDIRNLPSTVGSGFGLIVFDPPHLNFGKTSNMSKVYGHHTTAEILDTVKGGSAEAHRVSAHDALMAFKWNNHDISLQRCFELMPHWEPLFGHLTKNAAHPSSQTFWVMLRRREKPIAWQMELT